MTKGLQVRFATREDDAGIRDLLRRTPMPGALPLIFTYEPSFFDALGVLGENPKVVVGEKDGRIVGLGVMTQRRLLVDARVVEAGYLCGLRLDPSARGTLAMARGYQVLREASAASPQAQFHLTTILERNPARQLITSGRAGLPAYQEIGRYETLCLPAIHRRAHPPAGMRLTRGDDIGIQPLLQFLQGTGRRRQFFPAYTPEDLLGQSGLLRGLRLSDFLVAVRGGEIAGVLACWDQLPFRQEMVARYPAPLAVLRPLINAVCRPFACAILPPPGGPVRSLIAACVAIDQDSPDTFDALLDEARNEAARRQRALLAVGLAHGDPLLAIACRRLHLAIRSRIYAVTWRSDAAVPRITRPLYLELGSL